MKQVFHCKGAQGINEGGKEERWEQFFEFDGTKSKLFPVPDDPKAILASAKALDEVAHEPLDPTAAATADDHSRMMARLIALQEELDWRSYRAWGLTESRDLEHDLDGTPPLALGERAFEIALARKVADGTESTTWFERHGSTAITEIPSHWPKSYQQVVRRRIDLIESDRNIGLIERPEYKRRWNVESWGKQVDQALRVLLLQRLEATSNWPDPDSPILRPLTLSALADRAAHDTEFQAAAARLRGSDNYDVEKLVEEIALPDAVPAQSACRYKQTGLEKRRDWEHTWDLQRAEDRGEDVGEIPVPPKYKSADFQKSDYWRNRGKLDVPKETFLLYPHCNKPGEVLLGWAGWDHLQQIRALTNLYQQRKDEDGWEASQLVPILVAMQEVLPWVEQWHNEPDPVHGTKNGDAFRAYLEEELRRHNLTHDDLRNWRP
jgi:hypothetical protein